VKSTPTSIQIVEQIVDCKVISLLREGRVTDTFHVDLAGRELCAKVLKPGLLKDSNTILQFENEYEAFKKLKHRSFLAVVERGKIGDVPYYLTEYHPHGSLRDLVLGGEITEGNRHALVDSIVEAGSYLHSQGMIHFGVKPDNVIVSNCSLKLIQMGQVRFQGDSRSYPELLVTDGYTDPVVISGNGEVSKKSDVYSVAAVANFILSGRDASVTVAGINPTYSKIIKAGLDGEFRDCQEMLRCIGVESPPSISTAKDFRGPHLSEALSKTKKSSVLLLLLAIIIFSYSVYDFLILQNHHPTKELDVSLDHEDKESILNERIPQTTTRLRPLIKVEETEVIVASETKIEFDVFIKEQRKYLNSLVDPKIYKEYLSLQVGPNDYPATRSPIYKYSFPGRPQLDKNELVSHIPKFKQRFPAIAKYCADNTIPIRISDNFQNDSASTAESYAYFFDERYRKSRDDKETGEAYMKIWSARLVEAALVLDYLVTYLPPGDHQDILTSYVQPTLQALARAETVKFYKAKNQLVKMLTFNIFWPVIVRQLKNYNEKRHYYLSEVINANYVEDVEERTRFNRWVLHHPNLIRELTQGESILKTARSSLTNLLSKYQLQGEVLYYLHINGTMPRKSGNQLIEKIFMMGYPKEDAKLHLKRYYKLRKAVELENKLK